VPWAGGVELPMRLEVESGEINIRECIETGKIPRQLFQKLPRESHDAALHYLGYSDESAFYDFIAERGDGRIVRVDGLGVRDAIAARYADCSGNISDNCCAGDLDHVKMEFHMFYSRLPRIVLTR